MIDHTTTETFVVEKDIIQHVKVVCMLGGSHKFTLYVVSTLESELNSYLHEHEDKVNMLRIAIICEYIVDIESNKFIKCRNSIEDILESFEPLKISKTIQEDTGKVAKQLEKIKDY